MTMKEAIQYIKDVETDGYIILDELKDRLIDLLQKGTPQDVLLTEWKHFISDLEKAAKGLDITPRMKFEPIDIGPVVGQAEQSESEDEDCQIDCPEAPLSS